MESLSPLVIQTFWAHLNLCPDTGCWLWTGATLPNGYGRFTVYEDGIPVGFYAHRISWELHFGVIPADRIICHRCDVRNCANPLHLFAGSKFGRLYT